MASRKKKPTPKNKEAGLLGPAKTQAYRPTAISSIWGGPGGIGLFSLSLIDEMRRDWQINQALSFKQAPLHTAEFEVKANSPKVKAFVEKTIKRYWRKSLGVALECMPYGFSGSEVLYKEEDGLLQFDSLKYLHPRDVRPWTAGGKLAFVKVVQSFGGTLPGADSATGGVKLESATKARPAKGFWTVYDKKFSAWYGRSILTSAWWPWRLKTMPDGAMESLAKAFYKHGYGGVIARHPDEVYSDQAGQTPVSAQEYMQQIGEQIKAGSNISLSSRRDEHGNFVYAFEKYGGEVAANFEHLLSYPDWLDKLIVRGIGVPDEIITHDGNGLPLGAPVLTPTGWKPIGQLAVGDAVVDPDGAESVVTGVYLQGVRPIYKITFADGSTVIADENHRWKLHKNHSKGECVVLTTKEILAEMQQIDHPVERPNADTVCPGCGQKRVGFLEKRKAFQCKVKGCRKQFTNFGWHRRRHRNEGNRFFLPQVDPVAVSGHGDLPLDPYLVGLLLGDGGMTHDNVRFTSKDEQLVESLRALIPFGATLKQYASDDIDYTVINAPGVGGKKYSLMQKVKSLGMNRYSPEKFIPDVYLWACVADRIALLQGLMDTDGSVDKFGRAEYCSTSLRLAEQVQYLIQSLGGKVAIRKRMTKAGRICRNKSITSSRLAYVLNNIRFPMDSDINPFRLKRKADRYAARVRTHVKNGWGIKSIEPCGEAETVCISVSAPSALYFTEHFIPTHNTGGFSRSNIAWLAFLILAEEELNHQFELFEDQILRPLVMFNFGERAKYSVTPMPLMPDKDKGGAPGGWMPGLPGPPGAAPGGPPGLPGAPPALPPPLPKPQDDDPLAALGISMSHTATATVYPIVRSEIVDFSGGPHDYASTQFDLPEPVARQIQEFASEIPAQNIVEIEEDGHLTLLYGLHSSDPTLAISMLRGFGPIKVTLGETSLFEHTDTMSGHGAKPGKDVLKIDVFGGEDLMRLRRFLQENLANTQIFHVYKPHVTIAYVQAGTGKPFIGDKRFDGIKMTFDELVFSTCDGVKVCIPLTAGPVKIEHTEEPKAEAWPTAPAQQSMSPEEMAENASFYMSLRDELARQDHVDLSHQNRDTTDSGSTARLQASMDSLGTKISELVAKPSVNVTMPPINVNVPEQPAINVNVPEQPVTVNVPAPNVTVEAPEQQAPQVTVHVAAPEVTNVVNVPEQPAAKIDVEVAAPNVTVQVPQQPAPVVNVEAPVVNVETPKIASVTQVVRRNQEGEMLGSESKYDYQE